MNVINATNARKSLYQLISDVNTNAEPITIMNNRGKNAVLIAEDDWRAIQETMFLNSIPEMTESILEGGRTPLSECLEYNEDEEW